MSTSYLSQPAEYSPTKSSINLPLTLKVLEMKQGKYDVAKQQIQGTLDAFGQMQVLRPEDNEYIAAKLKDITAQVNEFGEKDLSQSNVTDALMGKIKSVARDPFVLNAMQITSKVRNFNQGVQKDREKNPNSYSDVNYQYSLEKAGLNKYMKGESDSIGELSYSPYTSWQKELQDISENIDKYDTEVKKTWSEDGYIYTREGKVITADKLKGIAESFLTNGAKKQMTIDGWASIYKGADETEKFNNTRTAFEGFKTQTLDRQRESVIMAQAQAKKTGSDEDKRNAEIAQENYNNIEKGLNDILTKGDAEQMYGTIYRESVLNNFADTFKYNTVDLADIKSDTTYMAKIDMAYKQSRDAIKDAQSQRTYELELRKAGLTTDSQGNLVGDGVFQTKADFGAEVPDVGNIQEQALSEIDGLDKMVQAKTEALYNNLDEDIQQAIDIEVKNSKGLRRREDIIIEYAEGGKISHADANALNSLVVERYVKQEEYQKYKTQAEKEVSKDLDTETTIKELASKPNVKMMWFSNGKPKLISVKDVLQATGVVNEKGEVVATLSSKKGLKEALEKSIFADKFLSSSSNNQLLKTNSELRRLASLFGETIDQVILEQGEEGHSGAGYQSNEINGNTKTGAFIREHQRAGAYDKTFRTDSFDDISAVNSYVKKQSPEEINKRIGQKIMDNTKTSFGLTTTVRPGTPEYVGLAQQAGFDIKSNLPIEIKKVPNQPNLVTISLGAGSATKIKPTQVANTPTLRIEDLPKSVLSQVNLYNTKPRITTENFPPVKQKATYSDMKGVTLAGFAKQYYGGTDENSVFQASLTTKEGASEFYFSRFTDKLGTETNPTPLGKAIQNIINSPDTYVEAQKTENADGVFILPAIVKGITTVFTPKPTDEGGLINDNNAETAYKNIKFNPQKYINQYLVSVLQSENQNQIDKLIKIYGQ